MSSFTMRKAMGISKRGVLCRKNQEFAEKNLNKNEALRTIMPATEPLCHLVGVSPAKLSKEENIILEVELFTRICEELKESFKIKYKDYFRIIKCNAEMENAIVEANFVRCVINDILSTEEYTLDGIACYTQTPEEVVHEIAMGWNTSPSALLLRKIIELHRSVRRELYNEMMRKISATILLSE